LVSVHIKAEVNQTHMIGMLNGYFILANICYWFGFQVFEKDWKKRFNTLIPSEICIVWTCNIYVEGKLQNVKRNKTRKGIVLYQSAIVKTNVWTNI
jgi:hypothetical protein